MSQTVAPILEESQFITVSKFYLIKKLSLKIQKVIVRESCCSLI
jgi:hypothetical protein